jgi:hypothetical protein
MRNQVLLSKIYSDSSNVDTKTGMLTDDAITNISKESPMLGMSLRQKQTKDKLAIEQLSLERNKEQFGNYKLQKEAIRDNILKAIAAADSAHPGHEEETYQKTLNEGNLELRKGGLMPDSWQPSESDYHSAKKYSLSYAEQKNPVQQVEEARDQINDLKTEYTHLEPGSPQAKQMLQKIQDGEAAINRMKAPTATMEGEGKTKYSNIQQAADGSFIGLNKFTGKMEKIPSAEGVQGKDRRDVLQADALSAYRARYPMGFMPEVYKGQPTPEEFTADYVKKKGGVDKVAPQKDDTAKRFEADKAMKGMTLGKKTDKGYEVMKDGKLIGHFQ